jgi:hypothetical protein
MFESIVQWLQRPGMCGCINMRLCVVDVVIMVMVRGVELRYDLKFVKNVFSLFLTE